MIHPCESTTLTTSELKKIKTSDANYEKKMEAIASQLKRLDPELHHAVFEKDEK